VPAARVEKAPAKINLTLRVIGRRPDGYHEIESLVAFAGVADVLSFTPGRILALAVSGPTAVASGKIADNLVLKAAHALAERVVGLKLGRFVLSKRLPVAAGLGGGSSDAAAALRLLARANRLARDDPRLMQAARATGADVPVCLDPRPRLMRGVGDILSDPLQLPRLHVVLVNPGVIVATRDVFSSLRLAPSTPGKPEFGWGRAGEGGGACATPAPHRTTPTPPQVGPARLAHSGAEPGQARVPWAGGYTALVAALADFGNDLEKPAIELQPVIGDVLAALNSLQSCRLARMSGSGATCFGLFETARAAAAAARKLRAEHPAWWIRATALAA
jgi:4-diphosphocytidyl-2-C-methyl-D-erythritol kinase